MEETIKIVSISERKVDITENTGEVDKTTGEAIHRKVSERTDSIVKVQFPDGSTKEIEGADVSDKAALEVYLQNVWAARNKKGEVSIAPEPAKPGDIFPAKPLPVLKKEHGTVQ